MLLCLLAIWYLAPAQTPVFRPHPIKEMGNVRMRTLFQDQRGWLWFGAQQGLYRFDGLAWQSISLPDTLAKVPVTAISESNGQIWVGFDNGEIGYLPTNTVLLTPSSEDEGKPANLGPALLQRWQPEEGTPRQRITGFADDGSGGLWIATYGEGLYCWKNNRLYNFDAVDGLVGLEIYTLARDAKGNIWAATDGGVSRCALSADGRKQVQNLGTADGLPDEIVTALCADSEGNIWIGSQDKGICRYNVGSARFEYVTADWSYGPVTSLALFGDNEVWAGTNEHGVVRYDAATLQLAPLPDRNPLRRLKIASLQKDREGLLWVVCDKGEVWSANVRFSRLDLPADVQTVWMDGRNRLWLGAAQGLFLQGANSSFRQILPGNQNVLTLWAAPKGQVWAGTFGNGVFILNSEGKLLRRITEKDGLPNGNVLSITGDGQRVWLATLGGVVALPYDGSIPASTKTPYEELDRSYVYKVFVDSRKRVWFGTDGKGLGLLEGGAFRRFDEAAGIGLKRIYSIVEDPSGKIWFSTDKEGLFCYDGQHFRHYGLENHLHNLNITSLVALPNGDILIACEGGLDILTPATDHVAFWDLASGAPTAETNLNAAWFDQHGNAWIGARQGLLRVATFPREHFLFDPQTSLTAVSVFLQPIDYVGQTVFPYDQNYFIFSFTGLWYTNPEQVRYRYRLEGFDLNWKDTKDHLASYPNLPPGHYVFRVQASEHGMFENTPEASYAFTIRQPFWMLWWFQVVCALATVGLLFLIIRGREARLHREALRKREKVEAQFATLKSQINPHFLFNSFNTLITIIEENPKIAVEYVEHLADFYRSMLVYREKEFIPLQEEMELVRNFDFLLKKRYEDNFVLNTTVNGQPGTIMPFTLQMLVENAVKHNVIARGRPLVIDIFVENSGDYVVVRNNVQRKIKPETGTRFGLQSLKKRYQLLGDRPVVVEDNSDYFTVKIPIL